MWIREECNIHIIVEYSSLYKKYSSYFYVSDDDKIEHELNIISLKNMSDYFKYDSYEDALEQVLVDALEKVIK